MKVRITKMILWSLAGLGFTIVLLRILNGPGSVTALSDIIPWGMWKGMGVVALVPIGGAGFTLAMLVYIFNLQRFRPLIRGAVLLGLICYSSVAFGLSMDIGIWWRIVFPVFHWQYHSVLFEIAWCIMLYLLVLAAEFGHTVFHRLGWKKPFAVVEKLSIGLVIFGISLSTLHQSSLGTLFLATPFRLHPLWHTDWLPVLFFVSSMALGCLTISFVTIVVYWLYGGKTPMKAIAGLGRISAYLMVAYLAVKFGQILASGEAGLLFQGTWDTANFWIEVALSAALPAALLFRSRYRWSTTAMFWISLCAILGMSLNRINVAGLATLGLTEAIYFPAWTEWAMTLGILSAAGLFYLFCVEYFGIFENLGTKIDRESTEPASFDPLDSKALYFGGQRLGAFRLYSAAFVLAAALSFGLVSRDAVHGVSPVKTPADDPRWVQVSKTGGADGSSATFAVVDVPGNPNLLDPVMLLDSNRDGRYVVFDHEQHVARYDEWKSCANCHHMSVPYDEYTGCYECHSDMYLSVNIFDHDLHVEKTGGNPHCIDCHTDLAAPKVIENTKPCLECHEGMVNEGSRVEHSSPRIDPLTVGYMDALHGLCIDCHEEVQESMEEPTEELSRCAHCHRALPDLADEAWRRQR